MAGTSITRSVVALAGSLRSSVGYTLSAACLTGLFGCAGTQAGWYHHQPKALLTLPAAQITPEHDPVVIDGRMTSPHEWDAAATVSFATYGQGKFLWNQQGLYGNVSYSGGRGRQPWAPGTSDADSTCVSVGGLVPMAPGSPDRNVMGPAATMPANWRDVRRIDLHIVAADEPTMGGLFAVLQSVSAGKNFRPVPLDSSSIRFASQKGHVSNNSAVTPWSCEFFIPWELLGARDGPPQHLWVMVFRVRQEDPDFVLAVPHP